MIFLVELDHVKSGTVPTPDAVRAFVEQIILPTLARAEHLVADKKILAGGPVLGRVALRLIMEADSPEHLDRMITTLPIWPMAETRVTPLITFGERREHVKQLAERLTLESA